MEQFLCLVDETNGTMETGFDSLGTVPVFVKVHVKKPRAIEQNGQFRVAGFFDQFSNYAEKVSVGEVVPTPLLGDGL